MKATGIVRQIDDLGRIVIPKELRKTLGLADGEPMEVFVEGEYVILKKYNPGCTLCGSVNHLRTVSDKLICRSCTNQIAESRGAPL